MQAPTCSGKTNAKLLIESVTPVSGTPEITIRNTGGQTANISNYKLEGGAGEPAIVEEPLEDHECIASPCQL